MQIWRNRYWECLYSGNFYFKWKPFGNERLNLKPSLMWVVTWLFMYAGCFVHSFSRVWLIYLFWKKPLIINAACSNVYFSGGWLWVQLDVWYAEYALYCWLRSNTKYFTTELGFLYKKKKYTLTQLDSEVLWKFVSEISTETYGYNIRCFVYN